MTDIIQFTIENATWEPIYREEEDIMKSGNCLLNSWFYFFQYLQFCFVGKSKLFKVGLSAQVIYDDYK